MGIRRLKKENCLYCQKEIKENKIVCSSECLINFLEESSNSKSEKQDPGCLVVLLFLIPIFTFLLYFTAS